MHSSVCFTKMVRKSIPLFLSLLMTICAIRRVIFRVSIRSACLDVSALYLLCV